LVIGNLAGLWEAIHPTANFDVDMTIVDKWVEIVVLHDVRRKDCNWDVHVGIVGGCMGVPKYKSLRSPIMHLALGVDTMLLKRSFAVMMSAVLVLMLPRYLTQPPNCPLDTMRDCFLGQ